MSKTLIRALVVTAACDVTLLLGCAPPPAQDVDCSDQATRTLACDGVCVNPKTDGDNCGTCGNACADVADNFVCSNGVCGPECATIDEQVCGDGADAVCVDVQTDATNCGSCGNDCGADDCVAGACADSTPPTVAIMTDDSDLGFGEMATLTFTSSEPSADFAVGDITVTDATLESFMAVSATVYTVTLVPNHSLTQITVDVNAGVFTDAAANGNTAATQLTIAEAQG